jgi:cytochrome c2
MTLKIYSGILAGAVALLAFTHTPAQAQDAKASVQYGSDAAAAKKGQKLYQARGCGGCHTVGKGKSAGPDLAGITDRRSADWLKSWLKDPTAMLGSDPVAQEMLKEYKGVKMPNLKLKDDEIEGLLHYLAAESQGKTAKK